MSQYKRNRRNRRKNAPKTFNNANSNKKPTIEEITTNICSGLIDSVKRNAERIAHCDSERMQNGLIISDQAEAIETNSESLLLALKEIEKLKKLTQHHTGLISALEQQVTKLKSIRSGKYDENAAKQPSPTPGQEGDDEDPYVGSLSPKAVSIDFDAEEASMFYYSFFIICEFACEFA